MKFEDYKTIPLGQDGYWVAEIPAIPGCYARLDTRETPWAELSKVFAMISEEVLENALKHRADSIEIVNAWRPEARRSASRLFPDPNGR